MSEDVVVPIDKVAVVFGTRPEAIKCAPVVAALKRVAGVETYVCTTGQHREMLDQVLQVFALKPDSDLRLMEPGQTLSEFVSRAVPALDTVFQRVTPGLILVQGDTNTAMCAALAATYNRIPCGHIEAGLRTYDMQSPWPEEANRQIISRLATIHFAPTSGARANLEAEGIPADQIIVTGNPIVDALNEICARSEQNCSAEANSLPSLASERQIVVITLHRREIQGAKFLSICGALARVAAQFPDTTFVFPSHLNPAVREGAWPLLCAPNVVRIEPLPYVSFVALMQRARLIITDSGGIQEEAPTLRRQALVLRDKTERPEAISSGWVTLVGTDAESVYAAVAESLSRPPIERSAPEAPNPFGDGNAGERIARCSVDFLRRSRQITARVVGQC